MGRAEKVREMMDQISVAYSNEEVKQLPEVRAMLFERAQELEKDENYSLVATKLCKQIALYAFDYKMKFPKALSELHNQLNQEAVKYDATAAASIMLPMWFL